MATVSPLPSGNLTYVHTEDLLQPALPYLLMDQIWIFSLSISIGLGQRWLTMQVQRSHQSISKVNEKAFMWSYIGRSLFNIESYQYSSIIVSMNLLWLFIGKGPLKSKLNCSKG